MITRAAQALSTSEHALEGTRDKRVGAQSLKDHETSIRSAGVVQKLHFP
jgi:hypothetical protein